MVRPYNSRDAHDDNSAFYSKDELRAQGLSSESVYYTGMDCLECDSVQGAREALELLIERSRNQPKKKTIRLRDWLRKAIETGQSGSGKAELELHPRSSGQFLFSCADSRVIHGSELVARCRSDLMANAKHSIHALTYNFCNHRAAEEKDLMYQEWLNLIRTAKRNMTIVLGIDYRKKKTGWKYPNDSVIIDRKVNALRAEAGRRGVRDFEIRLLAGNHAKILVVDRREVMIGSANMSVLSSYSCEAVVHMRNESLAEHMIQMIDDRPLAKQSDEDALPEVDEVLLRDKEAVKSEKRLSKIKGKFIDNRPLSDYQP